MDAASNVPSSKNASSSVILVVANANTHKKTKYRLIFLT